MKIPMRADLAMTTTFSLAFGVVTLILVDAINLAAPERADQRMSWIPSWANALLQRLSSQDVDWLRLGAFSLFAIGFVLNLILWVGVQSNGRRRVLHAAGLLLAICTPLVALIWFSIGEAYLRDRGNGVGSGGFYGTWCFLIVVCLLIICGTLIAGVASRVVGRTKKR